MYLSQIQLQQFRSHHHAVFDFDPAVTVIVGPNGSGKTNILEAVYVVAAGKSFRDSDNELTRYGDDWWKLVATIDGGVREARYQNDKKSFIVHDKTISRLSGRSRMPVVLFEPDDLYMMHASPSSRRKYIDRFLSQTTVGYSTSLHRYERIVAQRNKFLKQSPHNDEDSVFVWDILLADEAEKIIRHRREVVQKWNQQLSGYYSNLASDSTVIEVEYTGVSSDNIKQQIVHLLKQRHNQDFITGITSVGPHRDDIVFSINHKPVATNASRGEVRSLVLALKKYETDVMAGHYETPPIVLLDDVFSELDISRQEELLKYFAGMQAIITTTSSPLQKVYRCIDLKG